jgi:conjugative transfer pilus assembly protein TraH
MDKYQTIIISYALTLILGLCINLIIAHTCYAGLDKLVEYAAPPGSISNVNAPAIIRDQAGGYMTGGSLILRGPRPKELNPISIQTPKLKFDACTGSADLRFGAMSYIQAAEFNDFLKGVARASGAYLVKMSIKTACPQCEDIMTYLETVARDINGLTMNQCALAQSLTKGAIGKIASNEKQRCMMEANAFDTDQDLFATSKKCHGKVGEPIDPARKEHKEFEDMLGDEFNLVWKALSKGTGAETNFRALMMSVSGTIISKKIDGRFIFSHKPSLLEDKELLERFVGTNNGSKIKLYQCDEDKKCLNPIEVENTLKPEETLYGNVLKIIDSLIKKVEIDNHELTEDEEALLSFSTIPILQLIDMELSSKASSVDTLSRIKEYIEVICYDVITNYMQIMLSRVVANVKILEEIQIDPTIIRNFVEDAEHTRQILQDAKISAFQKLKILMQVKERLINQMKEFEFNFGKMMEHIER